MMKQKEARGRQYWLNPRFCLVKDAVVKTRKNFVYRIYSPDLRNHTDAIIPH